MSRSLLTAYTFVVFSTLIICLRKIVQYISKLDVPFLDSLQPSGTIPKNLPPLSNDEQVSDRCVRILGLNPGMHTLHGTNCYLIGTGKTKILIDTGESRTAVAWTAMLLDVILPATNTTQISHILLTHGHFDHQGGVRLLLQEMNARGMTTPIVHKRRITAVENDDVGPEIGDYPASSFPVQHLKDEEEFTCTGVTLRTLYTPGHTDDSVVFVLIEDFALISGDSVLGCGSSVFDELSSYMKSLEKIRQLMICRPTPAMNDSRRKKKLISAVHSIYPGHGPVVYNRALQHVDQYIDNRNNRERDLMNALIESGESQWVSSLELVPLVYGQLNPLITVSAQANLLQHLNKLYVEGQIEKMGFGLDVWRLRAKCE